METLAYHQFPLRWKHEQSRDRNGFLLSLLFHSTLFTALFFLLNVKPPLEPIVQIFSVALLEEAAAPPPPKLAPEPIEQEKKKEVPPPPPIEEDAISFEKPKKEIKNEPKPFQFKKKAIVRKKKIKKIVPPPKPVEKTPTLEDELRELELERLERMKQRTQTPTKKKDEFTTSSDIKIDAPEFPFDWYINAVKLQIDSNWAPMPELGQSIKQCIVAFVIGRDGQTLERSIEKTSGVPDFDLAALRAVTNSHFPPLPIGFNEPTLKIHIGFTHEPQ